jgi:hypothetical protein
LGEACVSLIDVVRDEAKGDEGRQERELILADDSSTRGSMSYAMIGVDGLAGIRSGS